MLFLLTNRTRPNLSPADYAELAQRAKAFYAQVPAGVRLVGEWAAVDQSRNFSLIEADSLATVQALQAPFEPFTDTEIVPVKAIEGWVAS